MKRKLALSLAACIGLSLTPSFALAAPEVVSSAPTMEASVDEAAQSGALSEEIAKVTALVKQKLQIPDSFTKFYGNSYDSGLTTYYSLEWSNANEYIYVTATESGQITRYSHEFYESGSNDHYNFDPRFQTHEQSAAYGVALDFLKTAMGNEYSLPPLDDQQQSAHEDYLRFSGKLYMNGIPTSQNVRVTLDGESLMVTSFSADFYEEHHIGAIPAATATVKAADAATTLDAKFEFPLAYYLPEDSTEARLQYRPLVSGQFLVDAKTGALIDMEALYEEANRQMGGEYFLANEETEAPAAADTAGGDYGLSEVEQSQIDLLSSILNEEALDEAARKIAPLALDSRFTHGQTDYYAIDADEGIYAAELLYFRDVDAESLGLSRSDFSDWQEEYGAAVIQKHVTLNAETGELLSLWTSYPYVPSELQSETDTDYTEEAADVLKTLAPAYFPETEPDEDAEESNFRYVRTVNGYPFPQDTLSVRMNPYTGELAYYDCAWSEDVSFAAATPLIGEEKALSVYKESLDCTLQYESLPKALDPTSSEYSLYLEQGYGYLYEMALVYGYEQSEELYAIDALTAEALYDNSREDSPIHYTDLEGYAGRGDAEALARYGIGFTGASLAPGEALTEEAMLELLLSAAGTSLVWLGEDEALYMEARYLGISLPETEDTQRRITKGEFVKTIVTLSPYGPAAEVPGVFALQYPDAADIDADMVGYAAMAAGLGLLEDSESFAGETILSRGEAVSILYRYLARAN